MMKRSIAAWLLFTGVFTGSALAAAPGVPKHVPVNWMGPTGGPHPRLKPGQQVWIDVSISHQRVMIKEGDRTLYSMVMSSGKEPEYASPRGTFYVEPERGEWFYAARYREGAKYWVSWKGHGVYLFHTIPMDRHQRVIEAEARKLGTKASHGCFRLSIADARWIYENIPTGTKVVVHD